MHFFIGLGQVVRVPLKFECTPGAPEQRIGAQKRSLADIRNSAAHGDPFDGMPWAGMLELVRDLIEYAYRNWR